MSKSRVYILCILLTVAPAACGQVITPQPPAESLPGETPTPTSRVAAGPAGTTPPLPPADTATPTVSPTPIIYVVKSGDTLLGIALEYGVSVEALQAANGIEDPQFLRVGQTLVIPTGEEETGGSSGGLLLPTPTPVPLEVQGLAFYETPVGSLWCLGEVVNTTASPITNVHVRTTLFDAAGQRVGEEDAFAAADLIPPGERSPFGILFTDPPAEWATPQISIVRADAAGEVAASYVPLSVIEPEGRPSGPQFEVSGAVQNSSPDRPAYRVSVIAVTYDTEGLVTGFRQETIEIEGPLAPGATAPFTMLFDVHGDAPEDLYVIALGYVSPE